MESYNTLIEAINGLKAQGYTEDFNAMGAELVCHEKKINLMPEDFEVDKFFRFEGESSPEDSSILYAIRSDKYGVKGVLVNSYSIYSDALADNLAEKLKV